MFDINGIILPLYEGKGGDSVKLWQQAVNKIVKTKLLDVDGEFGHATEAATMKVQSLLGVGIDGVVGPKTLSAAMKFLRAIDNDPEQTEIQGFDARAFSDFAERELSHGLTWSPNNRCREYTKAFEPVMGKGRFPWCAATVHWLCNNFDGKGGLNIPIRIPGEPYYMCLVEQWQMWLQKLGFYHDNDGKFVPQAGDIVMFDWNQTSIHESDRDWEDHIGVFLRKSGDRYICAEGNAGNKAAIKLRYSINIQGYGRFPQGWKYGS